ncbi:MAG TPA: transporter substrate-binding domain-containing protein [Thermoanaerobaculia bacterium]|nr:transporter substrate-binding domain-containing protein [Thermoanaerobaculia bacterium]
MRLTGFAKAFITLVILAMIGYVAFHYRDRLPKMSQMGTDTGSAPVDRSDPSATTSAAEQPPPPEIRGVLAKVRKSGVLRVGMEPDAPPLHFINDSQQEDGFDFQIAARIVKHIGADRVKVVEADYEDLPPLLLKGDIDIIMAGYVPDPDIRGVDWSQGYLDFGLCLIVQEGMVAEYRELSDLAGKVIAIYDDPAAEKWVQTNIPGSTIRKFSGDKGWFEAVESGQADALVYDYPFAAVEIKKHPQTVIAKYNLNKSKYAVGVATNNYDLIYEINQALEKVRDSDQYAKLMKTYLSSTSEAFMKPVPGRRTHKVGPGDSLTSIARSKLGDARRWEEIWKLNSARVANPDLIYDDLVLLLP